MSRLLVVGDIHEPFCLDKYLSFCKRLYKKKECNRVLFIGDIIDSHYSSFHEQDPDGMSAGDELDLSIRKVKRWYRAFPKADVVIGNHDRIVSRKAFSAGVSKRWIRSCPEVLGTPNWTFHQSIKIDGVKYCHGEGKKGIQRAKADMVSNVQGHYHTECYVQWAVGDSFRVFGMQSGCGIDHESYAMAYGKHGPKPAIACGFVENGGKSDLDEVSVYPMAL